MAVRYKLLLLYRLSKGNFFSVDFTYNQSRFHDILRSCTIVFKLSRNNNIYAKRGLREGQTKLYNILRFGTIVCLSSKAKIII